MAMDKISFNYTVGQKTILGNIASFVITKAGLYLS